MAGKTLEFAGSIKNFKAQDGKITIQMDTQTSKVSLDKLDEISQSGGLQITLEASQQEMIDDEGNVDKDAENSENEAAESDNAEGSENVQQDLFDEDGKNEEGQDVDQGEAAENTEPRDEKTDSGYVSIADADDEPDPEVVEDSFGDEIDDADLNETAQLGLVDDAGVPAE